MGIVQLSRCTLQSNYKVQIPALLFTSCVSLSKLLNYLALQFPHLKMDSSYRHIVTTECLGASKALMLTPGAVSAPLVSAIIVVTTADWIWGDSSFLQPM